MRQLTEQQQKLLNELYAAKTAIISGRAQSYSIGGRSLTYIDLKYIDDQIAELEGKTAPKFRQVRPMMR